VLCHEQCLEAHILDYSSIAPPLHEYALPRQGTLSVKARTSPLLPAKEKETNLHAIHGNKLSMKKS